MPTPNPPYPYPPNDPVPCELTVGLSEEQIAALKAWAQEQANAKFDAGLAASQQQESA